MASHGKVLQALSKAADEHHHGKGSADGNVSSSSARSWRYQPGDEEHPFTTSSGPEIEDTKGTLRSQCALCRLGFTPVEEVDAVHRDQLRETGPQYFHKGYQPRDLAVLDLPPVVHFPDPFALCHAGCLALFRAGRAAGVPRAVEPSYPPEEQRQRRRVLWLLRRFGAVLRHQVGLPLPTEVCELVAEHCLGSYTTRAVRQRLVEAPVPFRFEVDVERPVWARRVDFEGVGYVARLSNEPPDGSNDAPIFTPTEGQLVRALFVADDCWGVRDVFISTSVEPPDVPCQDGLWWHTVPSISEAGQDSNILRGLTDGLKLRGLAFGPWKNHLEYHMLAARRTRWEKPQRALTRRGYHEEILHARWCGERLADMPCSGPEASGYGVCLAHDMLSIHAHLPGTEHMREEFNTRVHPGTESDWPLPNNLTSSGSSPARCLKCQSDPAPSEAGRFFISYGPFSGWFQYRPPSHLPHRHFAARRYRSSSASLVDVAGVTPYRATVAGSLVIVGLLLRYRDGCSATVGEARWDVAPGPEIAVDADSEALWLSAQNMVGTYMLVTGVHADGPGWLPDGEYFLRIPWSGELAWWFSPRLVDQTANK